MFALRGLAISFSSFFLIYSAVSLIGGLFWRRVWRWNRHLSPRRQANALFWFRILPFALAVGVTLSLAVPSFWLLEPRSVEESLGWPPLLFTLCGICILGTGVWNAAVALLTTSRTVDRWRFQASLIENTASDFPRRIPVLRTSAAAPPLTAAGILHPNVWLSASAEFLLTERELHLALRHELAHVQRRDNLRKLIFRALAFPGFAALENTWRELTEMAADDAAVSTASEALDLAAAVIKLSQLAPRLFPSDLTTALVHSSTHSLNARVERLVSWSECSSTPRRAGSLANQVSTILVLSFMLVASYQGLLVWTHAATEWLVK
jgi:hypothetical protein